MTVLSMEISIYLSEIFNAVSIIKDWGTTIKLLHFILAVNFVFIAVSHENNLFPTAFEVVFGQLEIRFA
jgi:hypothetical protein